MEKNFSGYCRVLDGSRLVFLEQDDDGTWEADCNYDADCPYRSEIYCKEGEIIRKSIQRRNLRPKPGRFCRSDRQGRLRRW